MNIANNGIVSRSRFGPITKARASLVFGAPRGGAMVSYNSMGGVGGYMHFNNAEGMQLAIKLDNMVDVRQKDKMAMWELNERLAEYVEKTRFLEFQNKRLVHEAEILKQMFNPDFDTLRNFYLVEMEQIRKIIETSEIKCSQLTSTVVAIERNLQPLEEEYTAVENVNDTNQSIKANLILRVGELETDLAILRRKVGSFESDTNRYRGSVNRLGEEHSNLRQDLDRESIATATAKTTLRELKDELAFLVESLKTKTTEMVHLAYRDTTAENRALWTSGFSHLFRAMHEDYMQRMEEVHTETESNFQLGMRQQQTSMSIDTTLSRHLAMETQKLRPQLNCLTTRSTELTTSIAQYERQVTEMTEDKARFTAEYHERINFLTSELQNSRTELEKTRLQVKDILDQKLSLEIDIAKYSELLDSEEVRITENIQSVLDDQRQVRQLMASSGYVDWSAQGGMSSSMSGGRFSSFGGRGSSFGSSFGTSFGTSFGYGFGGNSHRWRSKF